MRIAHSKSKQQGRRVGRGVKTRRGLTPRFLPLPLFGSQDFVSDRGLEKSQEGAIEHVIKLRRDQAWYLSNEGGSFT